MESLEDETRKFFVSEEGYRLTPYFDSEGYVSFGIGRNLVANPLTDEERSIGKKYGWGSPTFVEYLFKRDLLKVHVDLDHHYPWWRSMTETRQIAMMSMMFQLGAGKLRLFAPTMTLLREGRYIEAGRRLRNTLWARQTPGRADRVIKMFENG